jgi:capsular polysaccharide biosynthesis protein
MNPQEREIELYDYIVVLLKYKRFIFAATLLFGAVGWLLRPAAPSASYEADAVLIIKNLTAQSTTVDLPTTTQSSGFYEALALADDLKQELSDSLALNLSPRAMDGMLSVAILDPGIRLTVRSGDPKLPIGLVNTWAKLFVRRNSYINSEDGENYYKYVERQSQIARSRLDSTEKAKYDFEKANRIGFLKVKNAMLDSASIHMYQSLFNLDAELGQKAVMFTSAQMQYFVSLEDFRPSSPIVDVLSLKDKRTAQILLRQEMAEALEYFDQQTGFNRLKHQIIEAQIAHEIAEFPLLISQTEKELANQEPVLGDRPNPIFISLSEDLVKMRKSYAAAKRRLATLEPETSSADSAKTEATIEVTEVPNIDSLRESQVQLQTRQHALTNHYNKQLIDLQQLLDLRANKEHLASQLILLQKKIADVKDSLSTKLQDQQRLTRDLAIFNETVGRFSVLAEETRITREKAAGDIRVLTQAREVRTLPTSPAQAKTAVAAGVGFLLSTIFALLAEYIRKAKQVRIDDNPA